MEALLGKAEERKSGKSSASRPKGYWAAFGACVLLVSSAQLLHESASWSLDYGTVLGTFINLRAQSCNAHAVGLILGYALAQMRPDRLRAIALNDRFWVFFFALQTANVMAFYWSVGTSNVMTMIIVQVAGAASGAFFFALSCQATAGVGARVFLATVVALVALTTLTVPRTVQHLGGRCPGFGFRNTPYGACCRICRLFCSGYGGGCLLASAIRTRALCSDGSAATQGGNRRVVIVERPLSPCSSS
ncbi:hypothetical protein ADLECEL_16060 [Adlercreutzia equolifaciens subsp. celatus]|nr:hypothetical protein ADLECEL_16060 [Adlercreutzia equolifaciens subsp. celatus]